MGFELFGKSSGFTVSRAEDDERLDEFRALGVRNADHSCFHHGRMLDKGAFDIEGSHSVPRLADHIVRPADETDAAIALQLDGVTGTVISANNCRGVLTPIASEP